ncbi:cbb3-type cytochrome oxidase subunit 3 [Piscinibacter sakaiensis]|uniref:cbb3-type cytochrome oxidase subunit 3 n=1 Tax=Piscinibacter sakaiensis TaxID=1547922 RepID=UPI003AB0DF93
MSGLDINYLRAAVTLVSFVSFVAIVVWALSRRNKAGFAEAAQLPFAGEQRTGAKTSTESRDE